MKKKAIQAEVNIGVVGHVDHGKTTLVKALTGEWADKHSEEIKRGITIRLGYADTSIYKCEKCRRYSVNEKCTCGGTSKLQRRISFVDCPGHESLMSAMISGSSLMNGAILIIAANEPCPQEQTKEHLMILNLIGLKNIIVVQNKIDLVSKEEAQKNYNQIKKFLKGTIAENAPIIPIAAHYNLNIDALLEAIEKTIPTPKQKQDDKLKMLIARSFDTNKPGTNNPKKLIGGVIGGSIITGELNVGDEIQISPGINNQSITTKITSLSVKEGQLDHAHSGGLIGVGTQLDPTLTKGDKLIGSVVTLPNNTPKIMDSVTLSTNLVDREPKVENIKEKEVLVLNIGTATTVGTVTQVKGNQITMQLKKTIAGNTGDRVALSRRINGRWILIGMGTLK